DLRNIVGTLSVLGGSGNGNRLIISDAGDADAADTVTVTSSTITTTNGATATINYAVSGSFNDRSTPDGVVFYGSPLRSTYNIQSTLSGSTTRIVGGSANDTFNVSSDAPTGTAKVDGIQGLLAVQDGGRGVLNVSDRGSSPAKAGTLTPTSLTGLGMAGIAYTGLDELNVYLGSGSNTV